MFDLGWSELFIIAVVALLVVGPKELPILLRTIGKYVGVVRQHAAEFRSQFEAAMRETEFDSLKTEMTGLRDEVKGAFSEATRQPAKERAEADSDAEDELEPRVDKMPEKPAVPEGKVPKSEV